MDYLQHILQDTYSTTSLRHRLRILKSYISNHIFANQSQQEVAAEDSAWLSSLSPIFYQKFTAQNVTEIFNSIDVELKKIKILIMYLPFDADDTVAKQIGQYARRAYNQLILLDIKFDPNLTAGCALTWNGIYKDYSLRSKVQERKGDILESFKKFLQ